MKHNKPAEAYAKPHDMKGRSVTGEVPYEEYATNKSAKEVNISDPIPNGVSYGFAHTVKDTGVLMRGYGAATKGRMSKGPMA
jgi:hypothetical protein